LHRSAGLCWDSIIAHGLIGIIDERGQDHRKNYGAVGLVIFDMPGEEN